MKHARLWAFLMVLALALTASGAPVAATSFSVVEGSPVLFAGATFSKQEDDFTVRLDWIGLAADLQWSGATLRLGAAAHPATIVANDGAAAFTLGLGAGDRQNLQRSCRRRRVHHDIHAEHGRRVTVCHRWPRHGSHCKDRSQHQFRSGSGGVRHRSGQDDWPGLVAG